MEGWIKLKRKVIEEGLLTMPGAAFKVWIYCLLRAAPFPDASRELEAGELWLSYKELQCALSVGNKVMSSRTIAKSLRYLQTNGFLTSETIRFKGVKVKVIHWHNYQFSKESLSLTASKSTETIPVPSPVVESDRYQNNTSRVSFLTQASVEMKSESGLLIDTNEFPNETNRLSFLTPTGVEKKSVTGLEPSDANASETPKIVRIDKNIRKGRGGGEHTAALITTIQKLLYNFPRYNEAESSLIQEYWLTIITSRQDNQFSIGSIRLEMQEWEKYDTGLVVEALTLHLDRYPEKEVAYTRGIMRRMQKEQTEKKRKGKGAYRNGYPEESGGSSNANPKPKPGLPFFDRSKFEYNGGLPDLPGPGPAPE